MAVQLSPVITTRVQGGGGPFSVQSVDLERLGARASPVIVVDDFRVTGRPFGPHPHAGFATISYVFEDSEGHLRSRDSLGNDVVVGPGGIVWTQAGRGLIHEEIPAESGRELHGLQVFVNLSARNKLIAPRMFSLTPSEVPEWRGEAHDRVRVVVGSYEGLASPLVPAEPFTLLDVDLRQGINYTLDSAHNAIVYVRNGKVLARADGAQQQVRGDEAVGLHGGGPVTLAALTPSRLVILSGAELHDPIVQQGPFIMNDGSQIQAAVARYRAGEMGHLESLSA